MVAKRKSLSLESARGKLKVFVFGFAAFLALFIILIAGYAKSYEQKVLINSYLFGENISGKSREQISELLVQKENDNIGKTVRLRYEDREFTSTLEDLGWSLDEEATVNSIYNYGHGQKTISNIGNLLRSIFAKKNFSIVYEVNTKLLGDWVGSVNKEIAEGKIEGNVIVKNSEAIIVEPKTGEKINEEKLDSELDRSFSLTLDSDLYLELVEDRPLISAEQAQQFAQEAIDKSSEKITLIGPGGNALMYPNTLGSMIELKAEMTENGLFKKSEVKRIYVSLNDSKLRSFLESNAADLDIEPVDARFSISDGNVYLLRPSLDGEAVKIGESVEKIAKVFELNEEKSVELPFEDQEAAISAQSASDIEKFGIKELIGKATTDFSGSPDNRVHNINNGVKYISGALVRAGEEFSTIGKLGQIDASSGYLPELVIKEDETVPEFGGGLCQVSTTLFRAAMNAGLHISERQNHSYRVSYYEPPVGMDATIYSPKPDFRFVNTTDNAILVYGYVSGYKVTFEIYGTKDGRSVEITTPEVFDITSPPEPIYIDDPSLEPGEEKRIDRAHNGAKAAFYYRVRKGGELIEEERFFSYYVAWPAKYLRGPQPEGEKPAEASQDNGGEGGQT